jgi:carbon starvation protein
MLALKKIGWFALAGFAACCLAVLALQRGESVNAAWVIAATVAIQVIGYRFYSRFIAERVLGLDGARPTPALRRNDGLDYVPTDRWVVFGHHFAAIAGAGPLVGPVLAAQMGYLPGLLWLLVGVLLAGAVQDFMVLFLSLRRDARSLGEMIRDEIGPAAGTITLLGILVIMMILLAVLALVVVKALAISPWGSFTVAMTMPIALFMGIYLRYLRPGRVLEATIIGLVGLLLSIHYGGLVAADPVWGPRFTFEGIQLAWMLIGYGFVASVLPVWLLLAPRDYLSTFLKLGTVFLLAAAVLFVLPELHMPALTRFVDGSGPVFPGTLFPFLFITIACGAVSGWHALVSSGTTPKLLANEADARMIGYGGMLLECFVAVTALVAACALQPGVYFALNSPAAAIGTDVHSAAAAISQWGFVVTPEMLQQTASDIGETSILSRTGGAPTLAVGMAHILSQLFSGPGMLAFWYHYAILFEALFILTTVDAGTRIGRFLMQDLAGLAHPSLKRTDSWGANVLGSGLCVAAWGWFLVQGVTDPLGGINSLWPLFGIANQMLAAMALTFCCVALVRMRRERWLWVPMLPTAWLVACTLSAGWLKLFSDDVKIGFLAHAQKFGDALARGETLPPAKSLEDMERIVRNDWINASMTAILMALVVALVVLGARAAMRHRRSPDPLPEVPLAA